MILLLFFIKVKRFGDKKMNKRKSVSAIVPIYNEEKTISKVVNTLLKNNLIDEVICINDGSTDTSMDVLNRFKDKIEIIDLQKNQGKGFALSIGIKQAKGNIVAFIDADLTNLSDDHIRELLTPILNNETRGVVGYPSSIKGNLLNPLSNFSGERAYYKKDLISHVEEMAETRFGVEVFLNHLFDQEEIRKVPLRKLKGLFKHEKRRPSNTLAEYYGEFSEIIKEVIRQKGFLKAE
jgi:polyisoprenyl-phosphate glycosyltransferase